MNNPFLVFSFVVATFILGGLLYIYNPTPTEYKDPKIEDRVICTADAMLCPDGSYVGRSGPDCEFACLTPTSTSTDPEREVMAPTEVR